MLPRGSYEVVVDDDDDDGVCSGDYLEWLCAATAL